MFIFGDCSVYFILLFCQCVVTDPLPRKWIQEIKRMLLVHLTHGLFLTWAQKSHHLQIIYYNIYMLFNASFNPTPCLPLPRVYLLGEPTSLPVVANTHPPLSLVCQQLPHPLLALPPFHTPQFRLHYLHRQHQQLQSSSSGTCTVQCVCLHIVYCTRIYTLHQRILRVGCIGRYIPDSIWPIARD
jgi:hypothetical protein